MDFLKDRIKPLYFKCLRAAFGSAIIGMIYSIVDMAMAGQYHGPLGSAALAVASPVWNMIYSMGLLMGIGGSVLFSNLRGQSAENDDKSNEIFTSAVIGISVLALLMWILVGFFDKELLTLFGASESLLPLAQSYVRPIKYVVPLFLFNQMLSAFLRNDGNPGLAAKAVLIGGLFNVFGDYVCVFALDLGIYGAGLATAIGSTITFAILVSHFFSGKNTLRLIRPTRLIKKLRDISVTGFSTFFIDIAMGILTMLFNRQVLLLLGESALAVYGVIINVSTMIQCCTYSIGQAAQPILSANYGAHAGKRIRDTLRYALGTVAVFTLAVTAVCIAAPNLFVRVFMKPTAEVLQMAPAIIRVYSLSFLLLPFNVFSTYYFQSVMRPGTAFAVSVTRGAVLSGALIYLLPAAFGASMIWFAMPITELVVACYASLKMKQYTGQLPTERLEEA